MHQKGIGQGEVDLAVVSDGSGTPTELGDVASPSSSQWLTNNGLGNVGSVTTSSGASTCLLQYDLYGASLFGSSATNPCLGGGSQLSTLGYQYASRDPGTGDYTFGGRSYDPAKGAFATPDAFSPGSTATDLSVGSDPLTADAYNYVNGDPVNHIDPTGHNPCATEGVGPDGCTTSENRALDASDHGANIAGPWTPTRTYHSPPPLPTFTPGTYHLVQMNSEQVLERALAGYDARMAAAAQQRYLAEQALERQQAQELADARQQSSGGGGALSWLGDAGHWLWDHKGDVLMTAGLVAVQFVPGVDVVVDAGVAADVTATAIEGVDAVVSTADAGAAVADSAGEGSSMLERVAESCALNSFSTGTLVVMADGTTKAISQIKIGDKVKATDPTTGQTVSATVSHLFRNDDYNLADVVVRGGRGGTATLHSTQGHLFWDQTLNRWVMASQLRVGDALLTGDGGAVAVVAVHSWHGSDWMYDLTVDGVHTFFVMAGAIPALVHNCAASAGRGLWNLTREGASATARGGPFNSTFYKSLSDGTWWTRDLAGHAGSAFKVYTESSNGLRWLADADEYGDYVVGKWKGGTGLSIPWSQLASG